SVCFHSGLATAIPLHIQAPAGAFLGKTPSNWRKTRVSSALALHYHSAFKNTLAPISENQTAPPSAFFVPAIQHEPEQAVSYIHAVKQEPTNHAATQSTGLLVGGDVHRPRTGIFL